MKEIIELSEFPALEEYVFAILRDLGLDKVLPKDLIYQVQLTDRVTAYVERYKKPFKLTISMGMLKFATRGELAFVIGHESAHISQPGNAYHVEETRCDLLSVQRLIDAKISPQVAVDIFRKFADLQKHNPNLQSYVSFLKDSHAPLEQRIQHIKTYMGAKNKRGELKGFSLEKGILPADISDELDLRFKLEQSKKKPEPKKVVPQKKPTKSLKELKGTFEKEVQHSQNYLKVVAPLCEGLEQLKIDERDQDSLKLLNDIVDIAYKKLWPEPFSEVYKSVNKAVVWKQKRSGEDDLRPFGIFRKFQDYIRLLYNAKNVVFAQLIAYRIKSLVKELDQYQRILEEKELFVRLDLDECLIDHHSLEQIKVPHPELIAQDKSGVVGQAFWHLGFTRDESVLESMYFHKCHFLRRFAQDPERKAFCGIDSSDFLIGNKRYGITAKSTNLHVIRPFLVEQLSKEVLLNKAGFKSEIWACDFTDKVQRTRFVQQYIELLQIKMNSKHWRNISPDQANDVIEFLLSCFSEMIKNGDENKKQSVIAFFENIKALTDNVVVNNTNMLKYQPAKIPLSSPWVRFLVQHRDYFKMDWLYPYLFDLNRIHHFSLFGDPRKDTIFDDAGQYELFLELTGVQKITSLDEFFKVVDFYHKHQVEPDRRQIFWNRYSPGYPPGVKEQLLKDVYKSMPEVRLPSVEVEASKPVESNESLWGRLGAWLSSPTPSDSSEQKYPPQAQVLRLIEFIRHYAKDDRFSDLEFRHRFLKEKIHWLAPEAILSDGSTAAEHYQKIPTWSLVDIYLLFDQAAAFSDDVEQENFNQLLLQRIQEQKNPFKQIDYLHELVVKNSINDYRSRMTLIEMWAKAVSEAHDEKSHRRRLAALFKARNKIHIYRDVQQIVDKVFKHANTRDRSVLLDRLTEYLPLRRDELLAIHKRFKKVNEHNLADTFENNKRFAGFGALLRHIARNEELRLGFIDYLVSPLRFDSARIITDKILASGINSKDTSDIFDQMLGVYVSGITSKNEGFLRHLLMMRLYAFHTEYHQFSIELRSLVMNYLLMPSTSMLTAEAEAKAYQQALSYVIDRLMPLDQKGAISEQHTKWARSFFLAYIEEAPENTRYLILAGFLAASYDAEQLGAQRRIGQVIASLCKHMGPAYVKLAQALHSHPDVPDEIKADLKNVKSNIAAPYLWEIAERVERLPKEVGDKILELRKRLGAASYNIAVGVLEESAYKKIYDETIEEWRKNKHYAKYRYYSTGHAQQDSVSEARTTYPKGSAVLVLPREEVLEEAQHGFDHLTRTLMRWKAEGIEEVREVLLTVVGQTQKALVQEVDYTNTELQEKIALKKYEGAKITVDGYEVQFKLARTKEWSKEHRLLELAEGDHLNDFSQDSPVRVAAGKAIALHEIGSLLRGEEVDSDRHGGNFRMIEKDGVITITVFDLGELMLKPPSENEINDLANALPFMVGDILSGVNKRQPSFSDYMQSIKSKGGALSPYVTRCYRALLALQDAMHPLAPKDMLEVIGTLMQYRGVKPILHDSLKQILLTAASDGFDMTQPSSLISSYHLMKSAMGIAAKVISSSKLFESHDAQLDQSGERPSSELPYDSIRLDDQVEYERYTGKPMFTYHASKEGKSVGNATLFGTIEYCHEKGNPKRTNIMGASGVFETLKLPTQECDSMPLTYSQALKFEGVKGFRLGYLRALGKTTDWALAGLSPKISWVGGKVMQYSGVFYLRYQDRVAEQGSIDFGWVPTLQAAVDTGALIAVDAALGLSSKFFTWVSEKADTADYMKVSGASKQLADKLGWGAFLYQATQWHLPAMLINLAGGVTAEVGVTKFAGWFDLRAPIDPDVVSYLETLNIRPHQPSLDFLTELYQAIILNTTWNNLELALNVMTPLDPKKAFMNAYVDGRGGTCRAMSLGFFYMLRQLGFDAKLVSAFARETERHVFNDDHELHMSTIVTIGGKLYMADTGWPILADCPVELNGAEIDCGVVKFRCQQDDGVYKFQKFFEDKWYTYFEFQLKAREPSYFAAQRRYVHSEEYKLNEGLSCFKRTADSFYFYRHGKVKRIFWDTKEEEYDIQEQGGLKKMFVELFELPEDYIESIELKDFRSTVQEEQKELWAPEKKALSL